MSDPEKEVHSASRGGRLEVVQRILESNRNLDINSTHESGVWTALHEACDFGQFQIYRLLSEYPGIDMNKGDKEGRVGLYWASHRSRPDIVLDMLKDERVEVNKPTHHGETPFWKVCEIKNGSLLKIYYASKRFVDVDATSNQTSSRPNAPCITDTEGEWFTMTQRYREDPVGLAKELRQELNIPESELEKQLGMVLSLCSRIEELDGSGKAVCLADNQFTALPEKLAQIEGIVRLDLRSNPLGSLGSSLDAFTKLTALNLSNTKLQELPASLGKLPLEELIASRNLLSSLPKEFADLSKLKRLDLSSNAFEQLPDALSGLGSLVELDVSSNKLTSLPDWFSKTNVETLNLSYNPISLPACIPQLSKITTLRIAGCKLTEIPPEFCNLTQLLVLDAKENMISTLPQQFVNLVNLVELNLRGEPDFVAYQKEGEKQLSADAAHVISQLLTKSKSIKKLNLLRTKIGSEGGAHLCRALVWCFEKGGCSIERLELDDIPLETSEGLEIVPLDIRTKGADDVARFMQDLFRSPKAPPVYRSKLMVVGYESVGKTTVLDCVFHQSSWLVVKEKYLMFFNKRNRYWFELQGRELRQYTSDSKTKLVKTVLLQNRQWALEEIFVPPTKLSKGIVGFTLRKTAGENQGLVLELRCPDGEVKKDWVLRLKREVMNAATHGIEVTNQIVEHPLVKETVEKQGGKLELSVWDFAGQHDYYNNHHYFLQARTVFLVLWKMSEGDAGLRSLQFWFKSLAVHLPRSQNDASGKPLFSILVVGTFFDKLPEDQRTAASRALREKRIRALALEAGLSCQVEAFEVSCWDMTNIAPLRDSIVRNVLSHSYMGERVPLPYLMIERAIRHLRAGLKRGEALPLEPARSKSSPNLQAPRSAEDAASASASSASIAPSPSAPIGPEEATSEVPLVTVTRVLELLRSGELCEPGTPEASLGYDQLMTARALKLLFAWGECVYFDHRDGARGPEGQWIEEQEREREEQRQREEEARQREQGGSLEDGGVTERQRLEDEERQRRLEIEEQISSIVVLDPTFLTKHVLANLFKPALMSYFKDGIIEHDSLGFIWDRYAEHAPALMALMEKFEVCFRLRDKDRRTFKEQRSIISSLLPESPPADLAAIWPKACPAALRGEISRVVGFNVVPKEMVSRLMVRLHKLISNQRIWRYGIFLVSRQTQALVEVRITEAEEEDGVDLSAPTKVNEATLKGAPEGPAKLKRRDRFRPSGEMFVTVRGTNSFLRKQLMETIIEIIAVTADSYPGMTMHQFVRSPHSPETLVNLAEVLADSQRPAEERSLVCPKTFTPLSAEDLLVASGLLVLEPLSHEDAKAVEGLAGAGGGFGGPGGLSLSQDLRQVLREELTLAQRNLMHNAQQIIRHSYPSAFLLLPTPPGGEAPATLMEGLRALKARAEAAVFDRSELHCLCELHLRDEEGKMQVSWHPTAAQGVPVKELNETMKKIGPVLKATATIIQVVGVATRLAGVPFPNLAEVSEMVGTYCTKANDVLDKVNGAYDGLQLSSDEQVLAKIKDAGPGTIRPRALEGDALLAVKNLFGEVAGGFLTKAQLRQCFVLFDGPMGNTGDVYWLCPDHARMLELQNQQRTSEIKDKVASGYASFWA